MVEQPARAALIGSRWPHPEGEWAMPPSASSASEPANVAAATVPMRSASDLSGVPKNRWVEAMDVNRRVCQQPQSEITLRGDPPQRNGDGEDHPTECFP